MRKGLRHLNGMTMTAEKVLVNPWNYYSPIHKGMRFDDALVCINGIWYDANYDTDGNVVIYDVSNLKQMEKTVYYEPDCWKVGWTVPKQDDKYLVQISVVKREAC